MKEWYLENYSPNLTSGYESDALSEYAQSNFTDVLHTNFADTVLLCNYDLSEQKELKCVIQNNTANTQLKSIERQILCPIGTLRTGMYLYFENCFWIITGYPGNNKSYEKSIAILCQYKLKWQKSDGTIIERWCNMTSAAKYDVGESGNNTLVLTTNNFTLLIPNDDDSMTIEGKRVFIDKNKTHPRKVFKITRNDDSLYEYGEHGGVLSLIADKTEFSEGKDNTELMICDYMSPTTPPSSFNSDENLDKTTVFSTLLEYTGNAELKAGGNYKTITGVISDYDDNKTNEIGTFEIITIDELAPFIKFTIKDNILKIKILDNESAIGGIVRIKFSTLDGKNSTFTDFSIISNY